MLCKSTFRSLWFVFLIILQCFLSFLVFTRFLDSFNVSLNFSRFPDSFNVSLDFNQNRFLDSFNVFFSIFFNVYFNVYFNVSLDFNQNRFQGSCTMKLNSTTEMMPCTFPEISDIHPFAPIEQVNFCFTSIVENQGSDFVTIFLGILPVLINPVLKLSLHCASSLAKMFKLELLNI